MPNKISIFVGNSKKIANGNKNKNETNIEKIKREKTSSELVLRPDMKIASSHIFLKNFGDFNFTYLLANLQSDSYQFNLKNSISTFSNLL